MNESELKEKLQLCEKAPQGPYFVSFDDAHDAPDHEDSGLAMVDTGRADDWPIARLCEWNAARFIAAFDSITCAALVREVLRLRTALKEVYEAWQRTGHLALKAIEEAEKQP